MNPILERAVEEEGKKKEKKFEELYQKRKLLVAELNKAQGKSDFADGYGKTPSSVEMTAAFRKISRHDNKCEIGQEEDRWSWAGSRKRGKRRRGRGGEEEEKGEDGWVSKRKKKLSGMIKECRRVLSQAGTAGGTSGRPEDLSTANDETETSPLKSNQPQTKEDPAAADSDSDATVIMDDPQPPVVSLPPLLPLQLSPETPASAVPCPLCGQSFPSYAIELHAANCGDSHPDNTLPLPIIYID
ncbi:hypothetical protein GBAR_LOCUS13707 [Geodia barretti]|uniref:UBZ4-type domain-containing protein n=1 Tax=Geodia barretti TaxID=519541 RepID=A0AA35WR07_GEOBA|nr:hypothetical protein GBAR_LOCUS13707 [Geodia barretti]